MLEYVYIVKCPSCEDEHFYFFNDAKEFAMSSLSRKPIITQVEVNRNDFGECTDSADLGTVWSWEEMMKTDDEPVKSIFTKDDLKCNDCDAEFDELDNSVDDFKKPVPDDMSIEDLVEAMEENEDEVECALCNELFPKAECHYDEEEGYICAQCEEDTVKCTWCGFHYDPGECRKEVDLGWLCRGCEMAIRSRGETLTFREGSYWDLLDENYSKDPSDMVELEYPELTVTLFGPKRDVDDWDEIEHTDSHVFLVPKVEVATTIWENWITEEDVKDVEGGLETLEDDAAWDKFLETHFDDLFEKYQQQVLDYFKDEATEDFRERSQEDYNLGTWHDDSDRAYDEWRDNKSFDESAKPKSFLEELEDPDAYSERLADCPECGVTQSFDHETGICVNCGFSI